MSEKHMLHKPNQLIMSSHNQISVNQKKAYNIILHEAREALKANDRINEFTFSLTELKKKSGIKATDNKQLKDSLRKLMSVNVEVVKDNKEDWELFNLISYAGKEGNEIVIELPRFIRKALINGNFYTSLDLLSIKELSSKYAVILYEVLIRYRGSAIPYLSIDEFKDLMGVKDIKSYNNFALLRKKVIEIAITEIKEKLNIKIDYELKKKSRKIVGIKFLETTCSLRNVRIMDTKEANLKPEVIEAEIIEDTSFTSKLDKAINKTKRNIYLSRAWNGRTDNKISNMLKKYGAEFTIDVLKRAYEGCKSDINTTVVQYFNGIIKNINLEDKELLKSKQKQIKKKIATSKDVEVRETLEVKQISIKEEPTVKQEEFDYYALYESMNDFVKEELLNQAKEMYMKDTNTEIFTNTHEKIFNRIKNQYIKQIMISN